MVSEGERVTSGGEIQRNDADLTQLEKPFDWRQWWKDAGAMGISPSELKDLTPYEFDLMREGYHKNLESLWDIAKFQSYVTYANGSAAAGQDPVPFSEWLNPVDESLPTSQEIDPEYKARLEAKMNSI